MKRTLITLTSTGMLACRAMLPDAVQADDLAQAFAHPPAATRPGVYWYFMDGNLSREGMTRDLESMKAAGLGHLVFLEVNVGVPRGPVGFLSDDWQDLFVHAVREAERLGIEITLGSGPGWTGSGGPWVKPEQSMQHLVASRLEVQGPGPFGQTLQVPPPRRPFFGDVPPHLKAAWEGFFADVAVLAFPTPTAAAAVPDVDEKALYYRAPFTSQPGVRPYFMAPAEYPSGPPGSAIDPATIIDLSDRLKPDGALDWEVPPGRWTVLRFGSRNNGAVTRPAPHPGLGFECDKFDAAAFDAHLDEYVAALLEKVGPRKQGRGWTMLHIDSWEMGAQNWTARLRESFRERRGYDPQPYYPAYLGDVVGNRELTERFLWDLRLTGQDLVLENHAQHLKTVGRRHGLGLSIEPYDMNPNNDFDLGAVADVPMCEFWSIGFNSTFSCQVASSIGHVLGRRVIAAEAFTGAPGEDWKFYPGSLKNQGDWAFATGINRLTYHTFAHKPDESRPGMVMGPYGVHWDRGQTWWPLVEPYHRYIARCQMVLRQGRTIADVLYLMPEGAPNVFQPPPTAFVGSDELPDRRGYNFDGCSPRTLIQLAEARDGQVVFPSGASYRLLVLPNFPTMTPELAGKLEALVRDGATLMGSPPAKSPSLVNYPDCDRQVSRVARTLWGSATPPVQQTVRPHDRGRVVWGGPPSNDLYPPYDQTAQVLRDLGVPEDFTSTGPVRYTHRHTPNREIYFVANRTDRPVSFPCIFRVTGRNPELWNPLTGRIRSLPEFTRIAALTTVSLHFEAFESYLVVFPEAGSGLAPVPTFPTNFPELTDFATLEGPWEVSFDSTMGAPARARFASLVDWTTRPEPGIQTYSGIATYRKTFDLPGSVRGPCEAPVYLDLGTVQIMARVRLNGTDCGVAWTAPWRVEISEALQATGNTLEIEVANLWPNRMIGDARSAGSRYAETTYRPYQPDHPLLPSGLLGPVRLRTFESPL